MKQQQQQQNYALKASIKGCCMAIDFGRIIRQGGLKQIKWDLD